MSAAELLETAGAIGRRIVREAIWYEDRCSWVGAQAEEGRPGQLVITHAALGPDLYGGTSGVAVFLAQLHVATGEPQARQTALGAIRQAISRVGALPPATALGLYGGRLGVALGAAWVGRLLDDDAAVAAAAPLARDALALADQTREFDLLAGRAGAIVALVTLQALLDVPWLLTSAAHCADELMALAERRADDSCAWRSASVRSAEPLAGLSHGAAGAGLALLTMFNAAGQAEYRAAAERAFRYERGLFDTGVQNWPDLRNLTGRAAPRGERSYTTFWCHGAPGIALSRLRAVELLDDAVYRDEAVAGVNTTRAWVKSALATSSGNYSLCHGLAGNAETLLSAHEVLGADYEGDAALALEAGRSGIQTYARRGLPWPCGTHEGETPSLLLGLAGIGHFYLRLYDPNVPSVLLLRPERVVAGLPAGVR